jgi:maleylpyruvate isomerase
VRPKLYGYWRSSASWRVRIGLNLKGLDYDYVPVHLVRDGGEQHTTQFRGLNPLGQVPVLAVEEDGRTLHLTQSLAILEYLEERWPTPALLPRAPEDRARVRALAETINAGIQPLQNLSVTQHLSSLGADPQAWVRHFVSRGMDALEAAAGDSPFLGGDSPSVADCCLVPQLYSCRRFGVDLDACARLVAIEARCNALAAFEAAHPDRQPDAVRAP